MGRVRTNLARIPTMILVGIDHVRGRLARDDSEVEEGLEHTTARAAWEGGH